jgi:hypothetical protein
MLMLCSVHEDTGHIDLALVSSNSKKKRKAKKQENSEISPKRDRKESVEDETLEEDDANVS